MDINKIVEEIEKGNLVITPTDTVYGILSKSSDEEVIKKVFEAKQRDYSKPLLLLVNGVDMLKTVIKDINPIQEELINRYWPGKLTIIFNKNDKVFDLITCGKDTVGIRYPDNKDLLEIIGRVNEPLISTSANISKQDTIVSVDMLEDEIKKYISYIEDGGIIKASSSTIVCVIGDSVKILRDGELSKDIKDNFKIID